MSHLPPKVKTVAQSILRTMHNRHVGITPQLAAELALLLTDTHETLQTNSPWKDVLKRLQQETSDPRYSFAIMLNTMPPYSVLRLAMPILEEASRRIHLCLLFCQDEIQSPITSEIYAQYSQELNREIRTMAKEEDEVHRLFWLDRAMTLSAYSRRGGTGDPAVNNIPETTPQSLALISGLKPVLSKIPPLPSHSRRLTDPLQHREESRVKEGGFSGIQITRRPEDMEDILLSEFVNPQVVFADRLINTGFLALRRQSRREQLRDVLITGIMPFALTSTLSRDFIKSCWFDFIRRFGSMLTQSGRKRSEFRWLEGNSLGHLRQCSFLLQDLPVLENSSQKLHDTNFPKEFLMASGWLSNYLDERYRFKPVNRDNQKSSKLDKPGFTGIHRDLESAQSWAVSVWRSQEENFRWREIESHDHGKTAIAEGKSLHVEDYSIIHLMVFLPAQFRNQGHKKSAAGILGTLAGGFRLGNGPGRNLSITWVPDRITATQQWAFDCRGKGNSMVFSQDKSGIHVNSQTIAGGLEEVWRNQLIKEIKAI